MPRAKDLADSDQNGMSLIGYHDDDSDNCSVSSFCSTSKRESRLYSNTVSRSQAVNKSTDFSSAGIESSAFKMKPIDRRIFESQGDLGVPKVESRPVTEPIPFNFRTETRASRSQASKNISELKSTTTEPSPCRYYLRSNSCEPPSASTERHSRTRSASCSVSGKSLTLTVPITPNFRTAKRAVKKVILSSEEIEMQKIEEKKRQLKQKNQANKTYRQITVKSANKKEKLVVKATKKLTVPHSPNSRLDRKYGPKIVYEEPAPCMSAVKKDFTVAGPTVPQPFQFRTDLRIKANPQSYTSPVKSVAELAESFMKNARSQYVPESAAKLTVPTPFQFRTDLRIKANPQSYTSPIKSVAELAESFMKNARSQYVPESAAKLTEAHSPKLRTSARAKLVAKPLPKSQAEIEEEEMRCVSMFKAKPVDKKILESNGELGVPKVQSKSLTVCESFTFKTDARLRSKPVIEESAVKSSKPVESKPHSYVPTVPESPKFAKGKKNTTSVELRQKPHHSVMEKEKKRKEAEEREKLQKFVPKTTAVKEFKLRVDSRGSAYQQELEAAIARQQQEELERSTIKAKPAPDFSKMSASLEGFQSAVKLPLTEVRDFNLTSVKKHKLFQDDFKKHVDTLMAKEMEMREVHAKPVPSTLYEPDFQYEKEIRTPLRPMEINLATESRVNKRKTFDEYNLERISEAERQSELVKMLKDAEESEQIQNIRRKSIAEGGLMYKAAPIMRHDPYPTHTIQAKPLTQAVSPELRTSKRARSRKSNTEEMVL